MAMGIRLNAGKATINGLSVSNASGAVIVPDQTITKQKLYFEVYFASNNYKIIGVNGIDMYSQYDSARCRAVGTYGIEIDHTTKTARLYINGALSSTKTYTVDYVSFHVYINEGGMNTVNYGSSSFKYKSPSGYPALDNLNDESYFFRVDNKLYYFRESSNEWVNHDGNFAVPDIGNKDLTFLTKIGKDGKLNSEFLRSSNNVDIVYFVGGRLPDTVKLKTTITPINSRLISMNQSIDTSRFIKVNAIKVNTTEVNNGKVRFIFSNDDGNSWFFFRNSIINNIQLNASNVLTSGNTAIELGNLSNKQLEVFAGGKFRMAIALDEPTNISRAVLNSFSLSVEKFGKWKSLSYGKEFDYKYHQRNQQLLVNLKSNGDFRINYIKPFEPDKDSNLEEVPIWDEFEL